jgi:hypothetical protein
MFVLDWLKQLLQSPRSYSLPGTYTIVWKYDDGNGNWLVRTKLLLLPVSLTNDYFSAIVFIQQMQH